METIGYWSTQFFQKANHLLAGQLLAFFAQVVGLGLFVVQFGSSRIERNAHLFAGFVTGFVDGFQDDFDGFVIGLERRGITAFIADQGGITARLEDGLEGMVDFCTPAQAFGEGGSAEGHDHEFLGIGGLPGGVRAAIEDVHHRDGQHMGIDAADVAVERQAEGIGGSFGNCQAGAQNGIGAQLGFIGGAVQLDHGHIDGFLLDGIPADQGIGDLAIDILNRFENTLAEVAGFVAIAQFQGFMNTGGCAGGNCCPAPGAIARMTSTSTVGLPRESRISMAEIDSIVVSISLILFIFDVRRSFADQTVITFTSITDFNSPLPIFPTLAVGYTGVLAHRPHEGYKQADAAGWDGRGIPGGTGVPTMKG